MLADLMNVPGTTRLVRNDALHASGRTTVVMPSLVKADGSAPWIHLILWAGPEQLASD
jgi:hypothetical protein